MSQKLHDQPFSQRQLKAGETLKKIIAKIFINELIIFPTIDSKLITVTEARISPDFKHAKIFFIPLIGQRSEEFLEILNNFSKEIKFKASKKWTAKFMPNLKFVLDESFDYAEKLKELLKKIKSEKFMNGWLMLNKPKGFTSNYCLNVLKKFNLKKTGYAGTLDPLATGLLPIAVGESTKSIKYFENLNKTYLFQVQWGAETTTIDQEGDIIKKNDIIPKKSQFCQY